MAFHWERLFQVQILKRGKAYWKDGAVTSLQKTENSIAASVNGSEIYHVEITMSGNTPGAMYCDCPYADKGEFCKHMAAVLYAAEEPAPELPEKRTTEKVVETLQGKPIGTVSGSGDRKQWKADLQTIVHRHKRSGYIDYRHAYGCMMELCEYLEGVCPTLLVSGAVSDAAVLTELVYTTAFSQSIDDSDGGLSQVSCCCTEAWKQILEMASDEQIQTIFSSLHKQLANAKWEYGTSDLEDVILTLDWPVTLLQKHLAWLDKNMTEYRLQDRVTLMKKLELEDSEVICYLEQRKDMEESYSLLLSLYEKTDIHKAIRMVQEHREQNADSWHKDIDTEKLIDLWEKAGETERYAAEVREYILKSGSVRIEYVAGLKAVTDAAEWEGLFFSILNCARYREQRLALLEFEKLYDMLLMEISGCPNLYIFLTYEKILRQQYPEQAKELYCTVLKNEMESANTRKGYQKVIAHLKKLKKYSDGDEAVRTLVRFWYTTYQNRTAMRDELQKAGYLQETV